MPDIKPELGNGDQPLSVDITDIPPGAAGAETPDPFEDGSEFKRSPAATAKWAEIGQKIDSEMPYGLGLDAPGQLCFERVEKNFQFRAVPEDDDFIFLHVEPLLDQAADLLDRGIRERMQWDDLAAKATTLGLELAEYKALDAIHAEEERDGYYSNEYLASQGEAAAANGSIPSLTEARNRMGLVATTISGSYNKAYNAHRKSAWLNGIVAYSFGDAPFKGYVKHKWDGVDYTVSDLSIQAAETLADYNFEQAYHGSLSQRESLNASIVGITWKKGFTDLINQWNGKNVSFRKRRTIAARNVQDVKARAATDADGLLNYGKRLPAIRDRFQSDFRNALARLKPAAKGLNELFGYDVALPADGTSISYFDDCLNWTRDAVHWLIRYARREQSSVVTISLRELVGAGWTDALIGGTLAVDIAESTFSGARGIRLRGVSMHYFLTATAEYKPRLLRARVKVPSSGLVRRLDGSAVQVDQSMLSTCHFGRVAERESTRIPDVFGAATLHNASPIGKWTISIDGFVAQGTALADIDDIELDLHIGFRLI